MKTFILIALLLSVTVINHADARSLKRKPAQAETGAEAVAAAGDGKEVQITDYVVKIKEDDGGVNVLFSKSKATYYLALDTANYDSMRKALEESLKTKKPVSVTADATLSNIVEVK
jgi:hypothetical protein